MSLRILLADESTNIKKAFQIALSDLGAEIKSVPSGLDVLSVSLNFKPTMIFADVLLTKKSGYEVCREINENYETKNIPVILMWSNFMEFNLALANQAGYAEKLEKPFDTNALRKVVHQFYTPNESHPLSGLIEFPALPEFSEEFTAVKLKNQTEPVAQNKIFLEENFNPTEIRKNNTIHIETESHGDFEEVILVQSQAQPDIQPKLQSNIQSNIQPNSRLQDNLIREEVRIMAEKICWQLIPEITEKLVKAELEKLMKNIETNL